jgi:Protein of unknown function (DUF3102)
MSIVASFNAAQEILAEIRQGEQLMYDGLTHYVNAGGLLIEQKQHVGHGNWLKWLGDNLDVSEDAAEKYMAVARHWPEIQSNSAFTRKMGIEAAYKLVPRRKDVAEILQANAGENVVDADVVEDEHQPVGDARRWLDVHKAIIELEQIIQNAEQLEPVGAANRLMTAARTARALAGKCDALARECKKQA